MAKVAILKTRPETVVDDYAKAMDLADYQTIPKDIKTILKLNLSWTLFFPACSTPPWELDGVVQKLKKDNFTDVVAVENQTVVTHPWKGAYYNKWLPILKDNNIKFQPLTNVEWTEYESKSDLLVMRELFGKVLVPKMFMDTNVIHFPTMKTHGHTTTTGAMKNAFGGLIPKYRHHAHKKIHEVLVDLLQIQKEIHKNIFSVMDGGICGNGAGPRTMKPFIGNLILASKDQVAIDAAAAKIMGFDPLKIPYIKMAHDKGLGIGDVDQIDIAGIDKTEFNNLNFNFKVTKSPIIRWDQILRKKTDKIKWLHKLLFYSPIFKSFIFSSETYHDRIWYPLIGKSRIRKVMKTPWGKLFKDYKTGEFPQYDKIKDWDPY